MAEPVSPEPRVLFCPFCGGGTLFIDPDNPTGFGCMKCKRGFQVAVRTDAEPPSPALYDASELDRRQRGRPVDDTPNMAGYGPEDFESDYSREQQESGEDVIDIHYLTKEKE